MQNLYRFRVFLILPLVLGVGALSAWLLVLPVISAANTLPANSIAVTTMEDEFGINPEACSLREAVQSANTDTDFGGCVLSGTPPYTINLPAGNYILSGAADENDNAGGDLDVLASMQIVGAGRDLTFVDGNQNDRVFDIAAPNLSVNFSGFAIQGGNVAAEGGGIENDSSLTLSNMTVYSNTATSNGGGIASNGTLTVTHSLIYSNSATAGNGGGIYKYAGTLMVVQSQILDNRGIFGGGISNVIGLVEVLSSTVAENRANQSGGGISTGTGFLESSTVVIIDSTIADNSAGANGGGIQSAHVHDNGVLNLTNSTISGNQADGNGGGLYNDTGSTAYLSNVTLSANTADLNADGTGNGGGIFRVGGTVNMKNTIVAGNQDASPEPDAIHPDVSGAVMGAAQNLISDLSGVSGSLGSGSDILDPQPGLKPLADNGGPTQTHDLRFNSPAREAASDCTDLTGSAVHSDQRGEPRPKGTFCDIGALEADYRLYLPLLRK